MTLALFDCISRGRSPGAPRRFPVIARFAVIAALVLPSAACSSLDSINIFAPPKYKTIIQPDQPADDLYNQGLARLQAGHASDAAKSFSTLSTDYPFTDYARKGLLMTTFSQYTAQEYDEAIGSAAQYVSLYPASPDAAYAMYLSAMSYYNQIPDISRDQDMSDKALSQFQALVDKYPTSEYTDDAKFKIQVTRDQLAGKDMSIGRYYLTRRQFPAAINRFHEVLAKYQTTREAEEALYRLTEAYLGLGVTSEAQTAAAVLGHNFPDSPWYKDAYALLKGNSLEPQEDQGSWMSKLFHKVGLG